jgi:hypothetical protein
MFRPWMAIFRCLTMLKLLHCTNIVLSIHHIWNRRNRNIQIYPLRREFVYTESHTGTEAGPSHWRSSAHASQLWYSFHYCSWDSWVKLQRLRFAAVTFALVFWIITNTSKQNGSYTSICHVYLATECIYGSNMILIVNSDFFPQVTFADWASKWRRSGFGETGTELIRRTKKGKAIPVTGREGP